MGAGVEEVAEGMVLVGMVVEQVGLGAWVASQDPLLVHTLHSQVN